MLKESIRVYKFTENIEVDKIQKSEKYWSYRVATVTYKTITHYELYYSKNLLALIRHRKALIKQLDEHKQANNEPSYSTSFEVKPTILERLSATESQKIR